MQLQSLDRAIRSRLARAAAPVCAIVLGSLAVACGSDEQPATPAPATAPPSAEAPAAAPNAPAGEAAPAPAPATDLDDKDAPQPTVTEGAIPEGFPSDVPVYPGAKPGTSMTAPGVGLFSVFESSDSPAAVIRHYRTELAKGGWRVVDTEGGDGVDGTKDGRTVQVRARAGESNPVITEIAISFDES